MITTHVSDASTRALELIDAEDATAPSLLCRPPRKEMA